MDTFQPNRILPLNRCPLAGTLHQFVSSEIRADPLTSPVFDSLLSDPDFFTKFHQFFKWNDKKIIQSILTTGSLLTSTYLDSFYSSFSSLPYFNLRIPEELWSYSNELLIISRQGSRNVASTSQKKHFPTPIPFFFYTIRDSRPSKFLRNPPGSPTSNYLKPINSLNLRLFRMYISA